MLSGYDLKISDESAEAMFSGHPYETAYNGEILFYDETEILTYKNKYFDVEDAFGFLKNELEAENFPRRFYGKQLIDYSGHVITVDEDVYDYNGYAFYSDESLEFMHFLGAREAVA